MLNGNAYSRSYWLTNAKGTIGIAFLGSKGTGSLTKVGKVPAKPKTTVNENVTNKSWENKKLNELLDTPIWHNAYALNGPTVPITVRDAFEQAIYNLSQIKALGNGSKSIDKTVKPNDVVPYRPRYSPLENHHGVMDVWAKYNVPNYVSRGGNTPTVALTKEQHAATKAVYRERLYEKTGKNV